MKITIGKLKQLIREASESHVWITASEIKVGDLIDFNAGTDKESRGPELVKVSSIDNDDGDIIINGEHGTFPTARVLKVMNPSAVQKRRK